MTNFSKSANSPINNAIELVKSMQRSLDAPAKYSEECSDNIFICIEQAGIAIENILLCLKQHEERIKELEAK